jgi:hypothetical protein
VNWRSTCGLNGLARHLHSVFSSARRFLGFLAILLPLLALAQLGKADLIQFHDIIPTPSGARAGGGYGFVGPAFDVQPTGALFGVHVYANELTPDLEEYIGFLADPAGPTNLGVVEIYTAEQDTSASGGCLADVLSGCQLVDNGVDYLVKQIVWPDGTVDSVYFESRIMPEPTSLLLLATVVIGFLALLKSKRSPLAR